MQTPYTKRKVSFPLHHFSSIIYYALQIVIYVLHFKLEIISFALLLWMEQAEINPIQFQFYNIWFGFYGGGGLP